MKIFLVGGAVRDALLNLPIKDKDWVVVGATPELMIAKGYQQVGRDFPVFLHPENHEEYALARTEYKSGKGYTGFVTKYSPNISLKQDLRRRDLTINAIAQDEDGNLIDPYNGRDDINKRVLRHVSEAFTEDPLRILRVARFAAKFAHLNFKVAKKTLQLMKDMVNNGELNYITPERIWKETEKALHSSNPQVYFKILRTCRALKIIFPEIDVLYSIPISKKYYSEINLGLHTLKTLEKAATLSNNVNIRFAALLHAVGNAWIPDQKLSTTDRNNITGISIIKNLCKRLHVPNATCDLALIVSEYHNFVHNVQYYSAKDLILMFDRIDAWRKPDRINQLAMVSQADFYSRYKNLNYIQGNYLKIAFKCAQSVPIKDIIKKGFQGLELRKELTLQRIAILQIKIKELQYNDSLIW
ncbi:multifunctional CCA addition/repair protein [Candidatus Ishikawella capsulata]|uniref:CCA-adding enzyme n=1 Tax=Candidatus Ishikawaella capsulata Mpkobe TaxID=476281 RepID=C5WDK6_9ENTR|nr:multifunctional CCA addition/repair protein [Candidatus Ishikawaella capsulata]BAH83412.1 fused tRNA nucleotidyl transferase/2'3'-cyclic phosphodiesterase/2'nucleotidase and phosphatase [Candidatus Ishikawaella capsulata Mpkobe]